MANDVAQIGVKPGAAPGDKSGRQIGKSRSMLDASKIGEDGT
jgi:hypothetical protein